MRREALWAVALGMCLAGNIPAVFAQRQMTVGDLLNQGAKQLTKEEVQKLYSGATVSGVQAGTPEVTFQNKHNPDGTVLGKSWRLGVWTGTVSGTWSMTDSGQLCYNLQNGLVRGCFYYFELNHRIFAAHADTRTEPVYERTFAR